VRLLLAASAVAVLCIAATLAAAPAGAHSEAAMQGDIARGIATAAKCEGQSWSVEDYSGCIDGEIGHAMDHDQASRAFQLGVYCAAFAKLAQAYQAGTWKQSLVDRDAAQAATVDQYGSCVFSAHALGIKAARICTTLGVTCDTFNAALHHWQRVSRR
jgi:hypothetical protein